MPKLNAFDKNENKKTKKMMLVIPMVLIVVAVVILASSYAIFQKQEEAVLINAQVGDFGTKTILNYVVDGTTKTSAPDKGNYIVTVDCGSTATATWDVTNWTINITKRNEKDIVCTISFFTDHTGEEVTVGTEHFFIIGENENNYVLLSKYNLDVTNNKQYDASATFSIYATAFSTSAYWTCPNTTNNKCYESDGKTYYNLNNVPHADATVVNAAKSYGEKLGGTGRLLTREELGTLVTLPSTTGTMKGSTEMLKIINGTYAIQGYLYYWLGSANNSSGVWNVNASDSGLHSYSYSDSNVRGIRPVIEISKSLVTGASSSSAIGKEIKKDGESFYIIGIDGSNLTLLSKYLLNVSTNMQYDSTVTRGTYKIIFSSTRYWDATTCSSYPCDLNGITNTEVTAISYAKNYATKLGGTGRLMTYEEAETLQSSNGNILYGRKMGLTQGYFDYWLGSAYNNDVYYVSGNLQGLDHTNCNNGDWFGIRPVVTISKSKVTAT